MIKNKSYILISFTAVFFAGAACAEGRDTVAQSVDSAGLPQAIVSVDSVTKVAAAIHDSGRAASDTGQGAASSMDSGQSVQGTMHRSVSRSMRRDMPSTGTSASDTHTIVQKKPEPPAVVEQPAKKPAAVRYLIIPGSQSQPSSGAHAQLKKSGVVLIIGACAIVAGAVAYYALKSSHDESAAAINNRIPPPPDPPPSHLSGLP